MFYLNPRERGQLVSVAGPGLPLVALGNSVPDYHTLASPPPGSREVLFAARMHPRKRRSRGSWRWRENTRRRCRREIHAGRLMKGSLRAAITGDLRISWEGPLTDAIPGRMAAADVYVLPSVREPYPMSVLEAMSVGLPVVVTTTVDWRRWSSSRRAVGRRRRRVPAIAAAVECILADRSRPVDGRTRQPTVRQFGMGLSVIVCWTHTPKSPKVTDELDDRQAPKVSGGSGLLLVGELAASVVAVSPQLRRAVARCCRRRSQHRRYWEPRGLADPDGGANRLVGVQFRAPRHGLCGRRMGGQAFTCQVDRAGGAPAPHCDRRRHRRLVGTQHGGGIMLPPTRSTRSSAVASKQRWSVRCGTKRRFRDRCRR